MACLLVDTNMLDHPELIAFLDADPTNKIVISEATMIEIHKSRAAENVPKLLASACMYWDRVLITQSFYDLFAFDGTAKNPAEAILSRQQTADFPHYCSTVVLAPLSLPTLKQFAKSQSEAAEEHSSLERSAPALMRLYRRVISNNFTEQDRQELRKRRPMSEGLQKKLIDFSFALRARLAHQQGQEQTTMRAAQAIDTPLYRYALSLVIYFMHWVKDGEPERAKLKSAVNQIVDLQIAAIATFYDGLATRETRLAAHFEELQGLIELLGGQVRCGERV